MSVSDSNRLVRRYVLPERVELTWIAPGRSRRLLRRSRAKSVPAVVLDVSVNGMRLSLPTQPRAEVGDTVVIESDGNSAAARVVRAEMNKIETMQICGVVITDMSDGFARDLNALVESLRTVKGQLVERWQGA